MSEYDTQFRPQPMVEVPSRESAALLGLGQALPLRQERPNESISLSIEPVAAAVIEVPPPPPPVVAVVSGQPGHRSEAVLTPPLPGPQQRVRDVGRALMQLAQELAPEVQLRLDGSADVQAQTCRAHLVLQAIDHMHRAQMVLRELEG